MTVISKLAKPALGDTVRDKLSGIEGIVVCKTFHLNRCEYLEVEPAAVDGRLSETIYKSIDRFEVIKEGNFGVSEDLSGNHIKLGDKVRDMVTQYEGIATMWNIPLFGQPRVAIAPGLTNEGKLHDEYFFDEERVEVLEAKDPPVAPEVKIETKKPGCAPAMARSMQPKFR